MRPSRRGCAAPQDDARGGGPACPTPRPTTAIFNIRHAEEAAGRLEARTVGRAGYSLLEILVALAIMGLGAAIIIPRAAGQMDGVVVHSVVFDFQRQVSELRRRAFNTETPLTLVARLPPADDRTDAPEPVVIGLRTGWSYRLSAPLGLAPSGVCADGVVDLVHQGRVRAHLASHDAACHFTRLW